MTADAKHAQRRVVFVTITFFPEPGALRGLPLARELRERHGWDVEVVTAVPWYPLGRVYPGYSMKLYQRETIDGIVVHRLPLYPSHDNSAARRILTYVTFMIAALLIVPFRVRGAPLIYHVDNLPTTGIAAAWFRLLWRSRIVQHIGDLWPDSVLASGMVGGGVRRVMGAVLNRVQSGVYRTNAAITVITEGFRQRLVERGVPREKVHVLPNWADEGRLLPVAADPAFRRSLGLDGKFVVLFAGNMGPLQALGVVLDAAALLPHRTDICFVLVGDGPDRARLEQQVAARRLGNVRMLPSCPVEEMPRLNAIADALLIHLKNEPFLHETVPSKTQVSLLAGKPILMGCQGPAAQIVTDAGAGICFTSENATEFAAAVERMAAMSVAEREALGDRGSRYYWNHLSLQAGANAMSDLFSSVLAGKPPFSSAFTTSERPAAHAGAA